jgi:iron(III) transport system permease protein
LYQAIGLTYCALLAALSAGLPLAVLILRAMPLRSFLEAWRTAREEIMTTVLLAALSATVGVAFAFGLAYAAKCRVGEVGHFGRNDRGNLDGIRLALRKAYPLSVVPFLVSGPVLGVGLIQLWNHRGLPGMVYDGFVIMVLACVGRYLVFGHFGLSVALHQLSPRMEEAAAVSGAGPWRRVTGIVLPLLRPVIVATWGLLFVLAMGELDTVLLVCPPGWTPLSVRLFSLMHYGPSQLVAALCVITATIILCAAGLAGLAYLGGRRLLHEGG